MDTEALAGRGDGLSAGDRPLSVSAKSSDGAWGTIDLNLLIVFDAVMQERNLTRAGRRLGLSQPATSHALARLRHMLHDDLFIRSPDGMRPTPRAEQMAEPIRDALRELRMTLEPEEFDSAIDARIYSRREQLRRTRDRAGIGAQGGRERAEREPGHQSHRHAGRVGPVGCRRWMSRWPSLSMAANGSSASASRMTILLYSWTGPSGRTGALTFCRAVGGDSAYRHHLDR